MIDFLEYRRLCAVTVTTTSEYVTFVGDNADDSISVSLADTESGSVPEGTINLSGNSITIDGQAGGTSNAANPALFSKPWRISLGGGNDDFRIGSFVSLRQVNVSLGDGNDYVHIAGRTAAISIDAGAGDDAAGVADGAYTGNFSFFGGIGRDRLTILGGQGDRQTVIAGKLQVIDTSGPFRFNMGLSRVVKETSVITGNSIDRLNFTQNTFARSLVVATHGGNDVLIGSQNVFRGEMTIAPGAGRDQVIGLIDE